MADLDYVSRAEWGARPPEGRRLLVPENVENAAIHWPGSAKIIDARGDAGFARICSALRGWQNYHMDDRGWSDIAYQIAVDNVGRPYTLRGIPVQSGANGNQDVNERFGAILCILGPGEQPTDAMCKTVGLVMEDYRERFSRVPRRPTKHSSVRPAGTTCPGPAATEAIAEGRFDAPLIVAPPEPPPPLPPVLEEHDMFITRYGTSLYRMFIDRRVIPLSEGTYNVLRDGGVPVRQLSNAAVDALASICENYLKVDQTPTEGTEDAFLVEILERVAALEAKIGTP